LTENQVASAQVLVSIDALLIEDLSEDETTHSPLRLSGESRRRHRCIQRVD
jgi:hypothetical protein